MNNNAPDTAQLVSERIRNSLRNIQNIYYYYEEDQLKSKDERGWNVVEYIEHFNMLMYHQIETMKTIENSSKGIILPKIFTKFFDTIFYHYLKRKKHNNLFFSTFIPVSIANPGVQLNAQKVFEDLIYGCEEVIRFCENQRVLDKIVIDSRLPGFISTQKKIDFIAEYFEDIVQQCKKFIQ